MLCFGEESFEKLLFGESLDEIDRLRAVYSADLLV
jgi:hypothetical protein